MNQTEDQGEVSMDIGSFNMSTASKTSFHRKIVKDDSFKIFSDKYWEDNKFSTALNYDIKDFTSNFSDNSADNLQNDYFE